MTSNSFREVIKKMIEAVVDERLASLLGDVGADGTQAKGRKRGPYKKRRAGAGEDEGND